MTIEMNQQANDYLFGYQAKYEQLLAFVRQQPHNDLSGTREGIWRQPRETSRPLEHPV